MVVKMEEMEFVNDAILYMYSRFNYCDKTWHFKFVPILTNSLKTFKVVWLPILKKSLLIL